ncbi:MAG: asparagine synthase (glutamine-hydrolyzing) [Candidatus Omnitrophica bacterium]|nr:asparagine synthase (glutamine-hydrolyzing) [Candidatus Omnitrophota bacterium]
MCGIAGFFSQSAVPKGLACSMLKHMNRIQKHRGPDHEGVWVDSAGRIGLAHVRLSILDLCPKADQPMLSENGNVISYNGEIYNFRELREELGKSKFRTSSDTEVILKAYEKWGERCVEKFRGMFAFALWDSSKKKLFVARDRFGIKPFYFTVQDGVFFFASEIKTLLPFLESAKVDLNGLRDYFTFQFCLSQRTLFEGIRELAPAHAGYVDTNLGLELKKYWEVHYDLDWKSSEAHFVEKIREKFSDSVRAHLVSDVEVGAYLSGGLDSGLVSSLARDFAPDRRFLAFNGKFSLGPKYDESNYARLLAKKKNIQLHEIEISSNDFIENMSKVIHHLDQPVAGPGSFPQFMVSREIKKHVKVVLGGQGGDEIFGGYIRYLIAYFEQCIKGAIEGTMNSGKFVVTYESIIPNLAALKGYEGLLEEFWAEGIFDARDKRYFRLINRANSIGDAVDWNIFNGSSSFDDFHRIYWGKNVGQESYFDSMTHFDFKTLLPALLHVEDRMSMAHGVESRVPFLDHDLVELLATIPSNIKFQNGELKRLLRISFGDELPAEITGRRDKMGFPVPLKLWLNDDSKVREFVMDIFRSGRARTRFYLREDFDPETLFGHEREFGRNLWAFLNLELWAREFLDHHEKFSETRTVQEKL